MTKADQQHHYEWLKIQYKETYKCAIEAEQKLDIATEALEEIRKCDYRGNMPTEQLIADKALKKINRLTKNK